MERRKNVHFLKRGCSYGTIKTKKKGDWTVSLSCLENAASENQFDFENQNLFSYKVKDCIKWLGVWLATAMPKGSIYWLAIL